MKLQGSFDRIASHVLVDALVRGMRSGVLACDDGTRQFRFHLRFGRLVHGASSSQKEDIFSFLVKQQIISKSEGTHFLNDRNEGMNQLFRSLPHSRKVEVIAALQARARVLLTDLLYAQRGNFVFTPNEQFLHQDEGVNVLSERVSQLPPSDLHRLIRLRSVIPFRELSFTINRDEPRLRKARISPRQAGILKDIARTPSLKNLLVKVPGRELFLLLDLLDLLERGFIQLEQSEASSAVSTAWQQKFNDFISLYSGCLKKINSLFNQWGGGDEQMLLSISLREALKLHPELYPRQNWPDDHREIPRMLALNIQSRPLNIQVVGFKQAMNCLLLQLFFTASRSYGSKAVSTIVEELTKALAVLSTKGTIHHQELAAELPAVFAVGSAFPSWLHIATCLKMSRREGELHDLVTHIPQSHPERDKVVALLTELEQAKRRKKRVNELLNLIRRHLENRELLEAQKLLRELRHLEPAHQHLSTLQKVYARLFDEVIGDYQDFELIPRINEQALSTPSAKEQLRSEHNKLLSVIDGSRTLKEIIGLKVMSKLKLILSLDSMKRKGWVTLLSPSAVLDEVLQQMDQELALSQKQHDQQSSEANTTQSEVEKILADVMHEQRTGNGLQEGMMPDSLILEMPKAHSADEIDRLVNETIDLILPEDEQADMMPVLPQGTPHTPTAEPDTSDITAQPPIEQGNKELADQHFQRGLAAMKEEDFSQAVEAFEAAIEAFPMGMAAQHYLEKARQAEKEQVVENLVGSAKWYFGQGDIEKSLTYLHQGLGLSPRHRELNYLRLEIYTSIENDEEIKKALQTLIDIEPYSADRYYELGKFYLDRGDIAQARRQFIQALRWNKNHPEANRELNLLP